MASLSDIARLNVLIELFSEAANAHDLESLLRLVSSRLRWVIDFEGCTIALERAEGRMCWVSTPSEESMSKVPIAALDEEERPLIERVFESGAPSSAPLAGFGVPLHGAGSARGVLSFRVAQSAYTYRDMRLAHHAGQYLGSLVSRLDLEEETRRMSRRKDDLLALLSHELRNPLVPIVAAVRLLEIRENGHATRELGIIKRQTQHLVRIVDDLLDVARLTRGKSELRSTPVEISKVIARAVEMVSPLFEERRHSLTRDVPARGLAIDGDENRLAQVVSNLLNNAAHYTASGGNVSVTARRLGLELVIEVADDGIGIAPEPLRHVFELFTQGSHRPSGKGGLGLGLVVVKELVELHGGSVAVASAGAGLGTTFTVVLPALPSSYVVAEDDAAVRPGHGIHVATASLRVLMVDDNEDALGLMSALVSHAGHEVLTARNGLEALAVLETFRPSVAVIDVHMPEMNGHALAARIRASLGVEQPYLIALTGYGQAADRAQTADAGFDEHLVKPIDIDALLRVIAAGKARDTRALTW